MKKFRCSKDPKRPKLSLLQIYHIVYKNEKKRRVQSDRFSLSTIMRRDFLENFT